MTETHILTDVATIQKIVASAIACEMKKFEQPRKMPSRLLNCTGAAKVLNVSYSTFTKKWRIWKEFHGFDADWCPDDNSRVMFDEDKLIAWKSRTDVV